VKETAVRGKDQPGIAIDLPIQDEMKGYERLVRIIHIDQVDLSELLGKRSKENDLPESQSRHAVNFDTVDIFMGILSTTNLHDRDLAGMPHGHELPRKGADVRLNPPDCRNVRRRDDQDAHEVDRTAPGLGGKVRQTDGIPIGPSVRVAKELSEDRGDSVTDCHY
jgi:hypothetical protein